MNDPFEYRRRVLLAAMCTAGALPLFGAAAGSAVAASVDEKRTGGPFVPTPQVVVDEMLKIGKVSGGDFVVDLGSGNGVIVLTAAQRYKAQGFGVDIDPELVKLANAEAKKLGIADRAAFYVQDVFKADISKASVVTLYLLPGMMINLRPKILKDLKPGTRVVSHDYHFDDWMPDDQYTWDVPEKEAINGVPRATVYLWIVPARIAGSWQLVLATPAAEKYDLTLKQRYQDISGVVAGGGRELSLTQSRLLGEDFTFAIPLSGGMHLFKGRVSGDRMEGTFTLPGGKGGAKWSATRVKA